MRENRVYARKKMKRQGAGKYKAGPDTVISFADKKSFLSQTKSWPEKTSGVAVCETHLSCVFLTDMYAWKLKKPVQRLPFFDFSTVGKRHYYCCEELRLNRRLAPDTYLDVVPLYYAEDTGLFIGTADFKEGAEVVDWLVMMKRLPEETTLRDRLANDEVSDYDIDRLAHRLIRFFEDADKVDFAPEEYIDRFHKDIAFNYQTVLQSGYDVPRPLLHDIHEQLVAFLLQGRSLLANRVRDKRVIEGHGDLRPEHIYFLPPDPPVIIDCLEFSKTLRILDTADELSFLRMACAVMGHEDVGERVFTIYSHVTGDRPHPALVGFYAAVRALTRARLALVHIQEVPDADPLLWHKKCLQYLKWAQYYCDRQKDTL